MPTPAASSKYYINPYRRDNPALPLIPDLAAVRTFHERLAEYCRTPLLPFPRTARALNLGGLFIKDESKRFGLNAFKALGAAYAMHMLLRDIEVSADSEESLVFCAATEGNHGRAVAWAARLFSHQAVIYMPENISPARIASIEEENARVVLVKGAYEDAVERAVRDSETFGHILLQDVSWSGYEHVTGWIVAGYMTMFEEALGQLAQLDIERPDIVIVQAGVGSFAGAAAIYFSRKYGSERPKMVCVEPLEADCMLASISSAGGKPGTSEGSLDTIMSCLNCARPSLFTWQVNRETYDVFIAVDDSWAEQAMRLLYSPPGGEQCLISGEAGCAGVAGLLALLQEQVLSEAARHLGINENSRVLVFSTEGDNDPETYSQIVNI